MDIQFYGANCLTIGYKNVRLVIDDNLSELGKNAILKPSDIALYTNEILKPKHIDARLVVDTPGEYEIADISIIGIPARAHVDEAGNNATMYKIVAGDIRFLIAGHIFPKLEENQLETIGLIDVLVVPVGGHGYTLDPSGALTLIKAIEPKLVIPTHYSDKTLNYPVPQTDLTEALHELSMEPKETVAKLKLRYSELAETTQLIVLETIKSGN